MQEREAEDSDEEPGSLDNGYDSDGVLTTSPENFAELRSVTRHPSAAQQAAQSAGPQPASQPRQERAATSRQGSGADDSAAAAKSAGKIAALLPRALSHPRGAALARSTACAQNAAFLWERHNWMPRQRFVSAVRSS